MLRETINQDILVSDHKKQTKHSNVHKLKWKAAGDKPQLIQGIRRRDGVGEGQGTTA